MNIEEEIGQVLDDLLVDSYDSPASESLAAAVMPLVKRAQAEAWEEGFDAAEADWTHHKDAGWGYEDCIDATFNPYADIESEVSDV